RPRRRLARRGGRPQLGPAAPLAAGGRPAAAERHMTPTTTARPSRDWRVGEPWLAPSCPGTSPPATAAARAKLRSMSPAVATRKPEPDVRSPSTPGWRRRIAILTPVPRLGPEEIAMAAFNPETTTLKTRQAIAHAQAISRELGHPETTSLHLLLAALQQEGGLALPLLERTGIHGSA